MDSTLELSMTEIEMQFEDMDDLAGPGAFDQDTALLQNTQLIEMQFKKQAELELDLELEREFDEGADSLAHFGRELEREI
ncbi:MAG TPA: hypothetical protein ENJ84_07465 [Gammaproteobacteria bacterium]|nr:hypothetical protein [Gammaproteobacteria bacterium]